MAVPTSQERKLRLREGKSVAHGPTPRKEQKLGSEAQGKVTVIYSGFLLSRKT